MTHTDGEAGITSTDERSGRGPGTPGGAPGDTRRGPQGDLGRGAQDGGGGTVPPRAAIEAARLDDALALARQAAHERDTALERIAQLEQEVVHAAAVRDVHVRQAQALASHLWKLQRQVSALLDSRRWKMGRRLGDALDRALLRHRDVAEDERIRRLLDGGRRLLGTVGETEVQLETERGRGLAEATLLRDLDRYLRDAVTDPVLEAPLDASGQHAVDVMEAYRDLLVRRLAGRRAGDATAPLVSVIMPTYDRAALLPRAIGSLLDQSYEHWELVVVDDGSTDGTDALLRSYTDPRIRVVRLEGNRGVSHARNRGLEQARGEVVAYLDSDNYWDEHYLLLMVGALEEHPGRDSVYCAQRIWEVVPGEAGEPARRLDGVRFAPFNRALLENRNYIDLNAFVHRRALVDGGPAFDESLPRLVDWDLFLRLTATSRPVALPCPLSHYEFGTAKNQLTRTIPVRPATQLIDDGTLQRVPLEVSLPRALASRYRDARLHAPLGGPRPARGRRPVTVVVRGEADGTRLRLCLDAVRAASPGADLRFLLAGGAHAAAARSAVTQAALDPDVDAVEPGGDAGAAVREAVEAAAAERDVLLLAADAVATPGWLEAFWEVLETVPGAALVAPRVVVMPGAPAFSEHVPYAKTYRELDVTLSRRDRNVLDPRADDDRGFVELSWARLTCAYLPRETVAAAGPPALAGADAPAGEDERAARVYGDLVRALAGLRVVYTPHAKVYHLP